MAALSHPNVVAIFDVGIGDTAFLVTEFLDGETLRCAHGTRPARCPRGHRHRAPGPPGSCRGACSRLGASRPEAGEHFLTRDGLVKILDFGLAKATPPVPGSSSDQDATMAVSVEGGSRRDGRLYGPRAGAQCRRGSSLRHLCRRRRALRDGHRRAGVPRRVSGRHDERCPARTAA